MNRTVFTPFFFVAILVLVVGLACGIDFGTATPVPPVSQASPQSEQVKPSEAPSVPTIASTSAPASPFYKEEFNTDVLSSWTQFYIKGMDNADTSKGSVSVADGKLVFNLNGEQLYSYLIYNGATYTDVRLEVSADNRGKNNNNVSLICRYSEEGWYEFSIANNGLYWIYAYDATGAVHKGYNRLANGGSTKIKTGRDTNVYAIVCSGDTLSLYINGEETNVFTDRTYQLGNGKVGVSVSSFNTLPIDVEFEYFDIQKPCACFVISRFCPAGFPAGLLFLIFLYVVNGFLLLTD